MVFNLSMLTQVDEIDKSRHIDGTLLEFMEMICRACAQASFAPPPVENDEDSYDEVHMSLTEREQQPLHEKLLNAMPAIVSACDGNF